MSEERKQRLARLSVSALLALVAGCLSQEAQEELRRDGEAELGRRMAETAKAEGHRRRFPVWEAGHENPLHAEIFDAWQAGLAKREIAFCLGVTLNNVNTAIRAEKDRRARHVDCLLIEAPSLG